jgi:NAD(P)-dependent dehydrogenase (short-subunit alcohol dehydrogenase family)
MSAASCPVTTFGSNRPTPQTLSGALPTHSDTEDYWTKTMGPKAVLITGASTGIGRSCALRLDRRGWRVFAGVRKQTDAASLTAECSDRVVPVSLDVTDKASLEATVNLLRIEVGDSGLQGLVNNAGISVQGPLEHVSLDDLRRQFEVNVTGQIAVTQAVLPLIRAGGGRIIMMSSISGRAMSVPLISPYSASKKALEALGEALRYELMADGIHVALIEPGSIDTPIWSKGEATVDPTLDALPPEGRRRYGSMIQGARKLAAQQARRAISADKVAQKVEHALTSSRPRLRYLVGGDAYIRVCVEPILPQSIKDLLIRRLFPS